MSWLDHHSRSEELSSLAEKELRAGNRSAAISYFADAAEAEERAFQLVENDKTRTLGILAVSATALFLKAGKFSDSERLAVDALARASLPSSARQQLRLLLQDSWFELQKAASTIAFLPDQVHVAVRGGNILHGAAPLDLVVDKVKSIQSIFYRTIEYLRGDPLRRRGAPKDEIVEACRPWLLQTLPGSYQFAVAVQRPSQPDFFREAIDPERVVRDFLNVVRAGTSEDTTLLERLVPQEDYRDAFVRLTSTLAPPTKKRDFDTIEVRGTGEERGIVLGPETRQVLKKHRKVDLLVPPDSHDPAPETVTGILRGLHLDEDWIEIAEGDVEIRISGIRDTLEDVIGPMTNRRVIATFTRSIRSSRLVDIELE